MLKWHWYIQTLGIFLYLIKGSFSLPTNEDPFHIPTANHAIYIGMIKIQHYSSDSLAELSINVFSDDLQDCLLDYFPKEEEILTSPICTISPSIIDKYFNQHVKCQVNQQIAQLRLVTCEKLSESHLLKFQMPCPPQWETVTVNAPFFMELFPTQSNVIQLKCNDRQYFARATLEQTQHQFICSQ